MLLLRLITILSILQKCNFFCVSFKIMSSSTRSRVNLNLSFKEEDKHTFTAYGSEFTIHSAPDNFEKEKGILDIIKEDFKWKKIKNDFIGFWSKVKGRIWAFFVEALWIPSYRPEWGKYNMWKYQYGYKTKKDKPLRKASEDSWAQLEEKQSERKLLRKAAIKQITHPKKVQNIYSARNLKHDPLGCEIIRFNITGLIYETQRKTLSEFPDTLLGDPIRRAKYWNPKRREYYFDRHRKSFEAILYYYQTAGVLIRPPEVSLPVFEEEIRFYDLGKHVINTYLADEGIMDNDDLAKPIPKNLLQRKIFVLMENPESSQQARFTGLFSMFVVILSTVLFCVETLQTFSVYEAYTTKVTDPFFLCEIVCVIWFSLELFIRFISCPNKLTFCKGWMNIIDAMSIAPILFTLTNSSLDNTTGGVVVKNNASTALLVLRVFRLFRVFRILKLSRHSTGLKILGKTLQSSLGELGLLMLFLVMGVIIFASLAYFIETLCGSDEFESIPDAFWWGVVTITSLGYGDKVPRTFAGKIVGSFCAVTAVLTLALPIPIFVANFDYFYSKETQEEGRKQMLRSKHVQPCEFLPECPNNNEVIQISDEDDDDEGDHELDLSRLTFNNHNTRLTFHDAGGEVMEILKILKSMKMPDSVNGEGPSGTQEKSKLSTTDENLTFPRV